MESKTSEVNGLPLISFPHADGHPLFFQTACGPSTRALHLHCRPQLAIFQNIISFSHFSFVFVRCSLFSSSHIMDQRRMLQLLFFFFDNFFLTTFFFSIIDNRVEESPTKCAVWSRSNLWGCRLGRGAYRLTLPMIEIIQ